MKEKNAKNYLKGQDKNKVDCANKNLKKFWKIFNNLCSMCKSRVLRNPNTELHKYCENCQSKVKKIWDS